MTTAPGTKKDQGKAEKSQPWSRRRIVILLIVCIVNMLLGSRYSILAPFFPQEAEAKGNTATQYGVVFGIYAVVSFLTAPLFGKLLSCNVPAKGVYCAGIFVDGFTCCLMGLLEYCPPGNVFFVLAVTVRAVMALGFTASYTCSCAIVASEFPEKADVFIPLLETSLGLGIIVGPTLGGMLYEIGGYMLPFLVMGGVQVVAAFATTVALPHIEKPKTDGTVNMRDVLDGRVLIDLLVAAACFYTMGFNDGTLAMHLQELNLPPVSSSFIFVIAGFLYAIGNFVFGKLAMCQRDPRCVCLLAPAFLLPCYVIIGPLPFVPFQATIGLVCVSQVLIGAGMAAYFMPAFVHAIQRAIDYKKLPSNVATFGLLSGLFTSAVCFGCFIGPIVAGVLVDHVGFRWATFYTFMIHVVVLLILLAAILHDRFCCKEDSELQPLVERSSSIPSYSEEYVEQEPRQNSHTENTAVTGNGG